MIRDLRTFILGPLILTALMGCGLASYTSEMIPQYVEESALPPAQMSLQGPSKVAAESCAGPYFVSLMDGNGDWATARSNLEVKLTASSGLIVYRDQDCREGLGPLKYERGGNRLSFYLRTEAIVPTGLLTVEASSFTSQNLPVEAQPVERLSLLDSPNTDSVFLAQTGQTATKNYDIRLQNSGNQTLQLLGLGPQTSFTSSSPFGFLGGTYPGTGGTCTTGVSLKPGESCLLRIFFQATTMARFEATLSLLAKSTSRTTEFSFPLVTETSATRLPVKLGKSSPASRSLCVIFNDGSVKCVGGSPNSLGYQSGSDRGTGTGLNSILMADNVIGIHAPLEVHTGGDFSCALFQNGEIKCWGLNAYGQLGRGNTTAVNTTVYSTPEPVSLGTGRTARKLAVGESHACAVLDNGSVKCWGRNNFGQLGIGSNNTQGTVTGNTGDSMLITDLNMGEIVDIAAGQSHTCAISASKKMKCWGLNNYGQLGIGSAGNFGEVPGSMGAGLPEVQLGTGYEPLQISASQTHTCALLLRSLDQKRRIKCWGRNTWGELGLGDTTSRGLLTSQMGDALPELPLPLDFDPAEVITNGDSTRDYGITCARSVQNKVKCWGQVWFSSWAYEYGDQPGDLDKVETDAGILGAGSSAPLSLTRSMRNFCALLKNQMVKCWGGGGADSTITPLSDGITPSGSGSIDLTYDGSVGSEELPFNRQTLVSDLRVGPSGTCVNWASGDQTCLGKISPVHVYSSPPLEPLTLLKSHPQAPFRDFRMGVNFMCAIGKDNQVYCLGENQDGQLGIGLAPGDRRDQFTNPVPLGTNFGVTSLRVGAYHACAQSSSRLKCWGRNDEGQLGLGDTLSRGNDLNAMGDNLPFVDLDAAAIYSLEIGESHNCASIFPNDIWSSGLVKCWGSNSHGQLGLSDTNNRGDNPGEMGSALPFLNLAFPSYASHVSLSLGNRHTCILAHDTQPVTESSQTGRMCFGKNDYGQLFLGNTTNRGDSPATGINTLTWMYVTGAPTVQLSLGKDFSCTSIIYPVSATPGSTPIPERRVICAGRGGYLGIDNTTNIGATSTSVTLAKLRGSHRGVLSLHSHPMAQHTCAIVQNERSPTDLSRVAKCWGLSDLAQTGVPQGGQNPIIGDQSAETENVGPIPGPLMQAPRNGVADYVQPGNYIYAVPAHVSRIRVAVWGAGGGGQNGPSPTFGGSSGAFSYRELPVRPGQQFQVTVGAGAEGLDPAGANLGSAGTRGGTSHFADSQGSVIMQAQGGTTLPGSHALAFGGELNLAGNTPVDQTGDPAPMGGFPRLHTGMTTGIPALQGRFPGGGGGTLYDPSSYQTQHFMGGKGAPGRVLIESVPDSVGTLGSAVEPAQIYDTAGVYRYLIPPGVRRLRVQMWGAGGAGGTASTAGAGACGGGGGAWIEQEISVRERQSYEITVGQGGLPVTATSSPQPGGNGGSSAIRGPGVNMTAGGGRGGGGAWTLSGQSCEGPNALYSTGGQASGSVSSANGEPGKPTSSGDGLLGGTGGSSPFGGAGGEARGACYPQAGQSPGGGGAGTQENCAVGIGGAGAPGRVIITPY